MDKKTILRLSPLLVLYLGIIIVLSKSNLVGDEQRYIFYATNITNGFYTPAENPTLVNGPFYPTILSLFIGLGINLIWAKLINAFLAFLAVIFFYKTLLFYFRPQRALLLSYILGLYPFVLKWLPSLYPEAISMFLICVFIYFFCKVHHTLFSWKDIILAGLPLGFLILTKFIFGYVGMASLVCLIALLAIKRSKSYLPALKILTVALVLCIPYLAYTYQLTDRWLYWGTNGGEQLYWMSSPYEQDLGDWHGHSKIVNRVHPDMPEEHYRFYNQIASLSAVEKNDAFRLKARENIKNNPGKYLKNWVANLGRFIVNFPYSYKQQDIKTLLYLPNFFLVVMVALSLIPIYKSRNVIPREIYLLVLFINIYFWGSSLVSASVRYFFVVVPFTILWLGIVWAKIVKVSLVKSINWSDKTP